MTMSHQSTFSRWGMTLRIYSLGRAKRLTSRRHINRAMTTFNNRIRRKRTNSDAFYWELTADEDGSLLDWGESYHKNDAIQDGSTAMFSLHFIQENTD